MILNSNENDKDIYERYYNVENDSLSRPKSK